jgi:hypothetical protein
MRVIVGGSLVHALLSDNVRHAGLGIYDLLIGALELRNDSFKVEYFEY